jgi:GT2 family glycosyltransferase
VRQQQPLVSIITVDYNGLNMTLELLKSIDQQSYRNIEVFVVDNASKQNSWEAIKTQFPNVHFIRSEKNLGFAGGNNLALQKAKGDFIFFINNDAEVTEGCIDLLLYQFKINEKLGIISPKLLYYNESKHQNEDLIQYAGTTAVHPLTGRNKTLGEKEPDLGQFSTAQKTAYAHGAAMMVSRAVIEKVGPMFEGFFLYYEELDWCARAEKAGFEIYIEPKAQVYHKESATVGALSPMKTYYINRNRVYFMRRNFSFFNILLFALFFHTVTLPKNLIAYLLKGETKHARAFLKAYIWNVKHSFSGTYTEAERIISIA